MYGAHFALVPFNTVLHSLIPEHVVQNTIFFLSINIH